MATSKKLSDLHDRLAEVLLDAVEGAEDENGNPVPPTAGMLSVARQFLKDNHITADLDKNKNLRSLEAALNDLPSFDADDEDYVQ